MYQVKSRENYAVKLGKRLDDFNAVDCGLYWYRVAIGGLILLN